MSMEQTSVTIHVGHSADPDWVKVYNETLDWKHAIQVRQESVRMAESALAACEARLIDMGVVIIRPEDKAPVKKPRVKEAKKRAYRLRFRTWSCLSEWYRQVDWSTVSFVTPSRLWCHGVAKAAGMSTNTVALGLQRFLEDKGFIVTPGREPRRRERYFDVRLKRDDP